jgi:L-lactate dehydrogenase complex protein LldF
MSVLDCSFTDIAEKEDYSFDNNNSIKKNIEKWNNSFKYSLNLFSDIDIAKNKVVNIRDKSIYNLDTLVFTFESNFNKNGGKVCFAQTTKDVNEIISKIIKERQIKSVVLSKSNLLEEISIRNFLKKKSVDYSNSDIGDFIVYSENNKPSHIVNSAIHHNLDEISQIFSANYGVDENANAQEIVKVASQKINENILGADAFITGANFLVADTGSIVFVENEGNILKSSLTAKTQIIIAGIDKVVSSLSDLNILLPMLSTHATGQNMTTYTDIVSGVDVESREEIYIIIVDNNRTNLLSDKTLRTALRCIHCGACANVCPIYKNIGGYAYNCTYPGPLGLIISPYIEKDEDNKHLPFVTTLCGKCREVCPAHININNLILHTRKDIIDNGLHTIEDEQFIKSLYKKTIKRRRMNRGSAGIKNWKLQRKLRKLWGSRRNLPKFAQTPFSVMYTENKERNNK